MLINWMTTNCSTKTKSKTNTALWISWLKGFMRYSFMVRSARKNKSQTQDSNYIYLNKKMKLIIATRKHCFRTQNPFAKFPNILFKCEECDYVSNLVWVTVKITRKSWCTLTKLYLRHLLSAFHFVSLWEQNQHPCVCSVLKQKYIRVKRNT